MKIHLPHYKEGVCVEVRHEYDSKGLDLESVDFKYLKSLSLYGTVEKGPETLTFRGHLTSEVEHICGRCLKSVSEPLDQDFELFYEIKGLEDIDTTDDLREALILNRPISFLCRDDCQGLCPQCGSNRNERPCDCEKRSQASPFSPLKRIWQGKKDQKKEDKRNG